MRAAQLPNRALQVAMILWFEAGCERRRRVSFCLGWAMKMNMSEDTARRGIRQLEMAGLISIERRPGRGLDVTILEAS